ncbi:MAG: hypothetical protein IT429_23560, partial [Gemmataceae bacterium]|nr:hypothetical protein [Gemmataceae bacterium]
MIGYEKHKLFDDEAAELQPSEWWRKRRHRSRQKKTMGSFAPALGTLPTLALIANHEYLLWVFDLMKQRGGQAPGLDGLRYGDFSRSEIAAALREIARATRDGTYRPHPYRSVLIPKEDGTSRELHLRNIIDRVVAGALYRALVPYFEPRLSGYGFRAAPEMWTAEGEPLERYNTWRLLADLELAITEEQRFVLAIDDVKKAFDNVNIDLVLAILAKHIQEAALLRLIEVVLRGGDDNHNIGIDQGSPLSPIILNILLTEAHDEPLSKEVDSP